MFLPLSSNVMKYILVTGGVISGVGKGIIASSLGVILKFHGIPCSAIKIDPYINIDAGTFSPYEHGEVFVLNDGGEVDLDLGNYERFLGIKLTRDNNITTGKIYKHVIDAERRGDYLGKTVQVVPHITGAIQDWVERVAHQPVDATGAKPQVCIIELGGTIGDIEGMPFVESFRHLQSRMKRENFMNLHVSLVLEPESTGEQKTKPLQNSVKELGRCGLYTDIIICRSKNPMQPNVRTKISDSCNVDEECVLNVPDVHSIYDVPLVLAQQGLLKRILEHFHLKIPSQVPGLKQWTIMANRYASLEDEVTIALVGKYVQLDDAYTSVNKALRHAAASCNRKVIVQKISSEDLELAARKNVLSDSYQRAWEKLGTCDGIIVPGGFGERGVEGKIIAARWARKNKKPFLGVCLGMQCAVIDFARDVLHWADANSTEFNPETKHPVVIDMPEHNQGQMGGTMRLGLRTTVFSSKDSIIKRLYGGQESVAERHRHRYEVNPEVVAQMEAHGLHFVGHGDPTDNDEDKLRMEIVELEDHPFFVGTQFHPEYMSSPLRASPAYLGLILAACGQLTAFLRDNRAPSPLNTLNMATGLLNGHQAEYPVSRSSPMTIRKSPVNGFGYRLGAGRDSQTSLTSLSSSV